MMRESRRRKESFNLGILPVIGTMLGLLFCNSALAAAKPIRPPASQTMDRVASNVIDYVDVEPYDKWLVLSVHFIHNIQYGWFLPRKPSKTFIIRLHAVPSVKKHNTLPQRGEYHAVPKEYRDVIESVTYDGSTDGGPYLIVQLYQQSELELKQGADSKAIQIRICPADETSSSKLPEGKPAETQHPPK